MFRCLQGGLVFLATLALYMLTAQRWLYGDGMTLVDEFLFRDSYWTHVLYLPAARALRAVFHPADPIDVLRLLSALSGALGALFTFLLVQRFCGSLHRSLIAAALTVVTPTVWFFCTTIEVHALHFAVVASGAYVVVSAPWERPRIALAMTLATLPWLYLSHTSGLLLAPGWLALVAYSRARTGQPFSLPHLAAIGLVCATVLLATLFLTGYLIPRTDVGGTLEFIGSFRQTMSFEYWRNGVFLGLGLLLPLAILGAMRMRGFQLALFAALVLPHLLFFTWYAESNRGGYFFGILPFLAVLVAEAVGRQRGGLWIGTLAVPTQALLSLWLLHQFDARYSEDEFETRTAIVRDAIGERGVVISFEPTLQPITLRFPAIRELNVREYLSDVVHQGLPPEEAGRRTLEYVRRVDQEYDVPVILDLSVKRVLMKYKTAEATLPYIRAIQDAVESAYGKAVLEHARFPMVVIQ